MENIENEIVYRPDRGKGKLLFDGEVIPSNEILEAIGEVGVEYIKKWFLAKIKCRKEMFAVAEKEFYGFRDLQVFFHLPTKTRIIASEIEDFVKYNQAETYNVDAVKYKDALKSDNFYILYSGGIHKRGIQSIMNRIKLGRR